MAEADCAAVVLAAGSSSRLRQPKQLIQINGESLLRRTVRLAGEAGCDPVAVVVGFEAERLRSELDGLGAIAAVNGDWRSGMGSSLRRGVAALMELDPRPRNVLLLVCDQVALRVEFLRELLRVHNSGADPTGDSGARITAARYSGRIGVPAVFSSRFFPEMMTVQSDQGARGILEAHAGQVATVDFPGGELDLDTPEQLGTIKANGECS
jgi:molybdenum cofactor cytidylyltransferase